MLSSVGSGAYTSASNADKGSHNSSDDLSESESDSMKKVQVAVAAATSGMTFDFDSTIGNCQIRMMEGPGYFAKGFAQAPGSELVPEPWVDEAVVFEDLFATGLHMPPHPALAHILQKFHVQLNQLMPNAIVQLSKFFWVVSSCRA
jgi:hypothetical protein